MKNEMSNSPLIVATVFPLILVALLICVGCNIVLDDLRTAPLDSKLEHTFSDHRNDFDTLVRMSDEDSKVIRIAYDFTWVVGEKKSGEMADRPIGFSRQRWEEYKTFFRKLNLEAGLSRAESGEIIMFPAYANSLDSGGIEAKGFMYSRSDEECQEGSLDNLRLREEKKFACKNLDPHWSLYISR